jgi:hypothetical protein
MKELRIGDVRDFGWGRSRGRFAMYVDFPRHDCSPFSHVNVRRESLGFVHRSRSSFCRPQCQTSVLRFETCFIAVCMSHPSQATHLCSTVTGLSTVRSYANFSRSLKRGSVQARCASVSARSHHSLILQGAQRRVSHQP